MADDMIAVKPARKGMNLSHPVTGPLRDEGGEWPNDQFTYRRLQDKDVKRVEPEDDKSERVEPKAPAPAPDLTAIKETVTATAQAAEPSKPARR